MSKLTLSEIIERATQPNLIDVSNFGLCCGMSASIIAVWACVRYPDVMHSIPTFLPSGKSITRIVRPREMPNSCEAWRDVYTEALNIIAKKFSLPSNNEGRWLSSNIFRCRARSDSEDHKSGIKTMKIVFTSSVYSHGVKA